MENITLLQCLLDAEYPHITKLYVMVNPVLLYQPTQGCSFHWYSLEEVTTYLFPPFVEAVELAITNPSTCVFVKTTRISRRWCYRVHFDTGQTVATSFNMEAQARAHL